MRIFLFRRAYTMLELLVAVVILGILGTLAIVSYQKYRERVDILVDQTNQKILAAAIRIHATDTGIVAGSLSELRPADLERAYAWVTQGRRPYTFLAFLKEWMGVGEALADSLPSRYFNNDLNILTCPRDDTPPRNVDDDFNRSYEISEEAACKTLAWLLNPANAGRLLLIDSEDDDSEDTGDCPSKKEDKKAYRHKHGGEDVSTVTLVDGRFFVEDRQGNRRRHSRE